MPVLLRTIYAEDPAFREVATLFTVHNIGYQGIFPPEILPLSCCRGTCSRLRGWNSSGR